MYFSDVNLKNVTRIVSINTPLLKQTVVTMTNNYYYHFINLLQVYNINLVEVYYYKFTVKLHQDLQTTRTHIVG